MDPHALRALYQDTTFMQSVTVIEIGQKRRSPPTSLKLFTVTSAIDRIIP